jgi:hypothetical protein
MEYDNVREALGFLIDVNEGNRKDMDFNGKLPSFEDLQETNREALYNVADLLGMSNLYLENSVSK